MKYLDTKYRKEIIDKKNIYGVYQNYLVEQYREDKKINIKTLFGADPNFWITITEIFYKEFIVRNKENAIYQSLL